MATTSPAWAQRRRRGPHTYFELTRGPPSARAGNRVTSKAKTVSENLKMGSALLSRFDLIFILVDKPDVRMDKFLSEHVMAVRTRTTTLGAADADGPR